MEKYTYDDDGADVGGCESIDGPSESFMSFNETDFSQGFTVRIIFKAGCPKDES